MNNRSPPSLSKDSKLKLEGLEAFRTRLFSEGDDEAQESGVADLKVGEYCKSLRLIVSHKFVPRGTISSFIGTDADGRTVTVVSYDSNSTMKDLGEGVFVSVSGRVKKNQDEYNMTSSGLDVVNPKLQSIEPFEIDHKAIQPMTIARANVLDNHEVVPLIVGRVQYQEKKNQTDFYTAKLIKIDLIDDADTRVEIVAFSKDAEETLAAVAGYSKSAPMKRYAFYRLKASVYQGSTNLVFKDGSDVTEWFDTTIESVDSKFDTKSQSNVNRKRKILPQSYRPVFSGNDAFLPFLKTKLV